MTFLQLVSQIYINVKQYGATGDGVTDDTSSITQAITAAAVSGGAVFFPPGTYLSGNQTLATNVSIQGTGIGATTIKLKNGANTDLFSGQTGSINPAASLGSGADGTLYGFGFRDLTLDGNYSNQTGGPSWVLRFYAHSYILENVCIKNGYSGGVLSDWNGPSVQEPDVPNGIECRWRNVQVHDNKGVAGAPGILFSGPHDSQMDTIISSNNYGHNLQVAPNAVGLQLSNFHGWGQFGTDTWCIVLEAGVSTLSNIRIETASNLNGLALLSQQSVISGIATAFGTNTSVGIKLGQAAGETPIPGQYLQSAGVTTLVYADNNLIDMFLSNFGGHGMNFDGAHHNIINVVSLQGSGDLYTGFLDPTNILNLNESGLTTDGTMPKGGTFNVGVDSFNAFTVTNATTYSTYFNVNTHANQRIDLPNATYIQFYSDQFSTASGAMYAGAGAPSNAVGNNGDYYFRSGTPGTANQRIYVKSAGVWVGIV